MASARAVAAVAGDRDGGDGLAGVGGAELRVAGEAAVAGEGDHRGTSWDPDGWWLTQPGQAGDPDGAATTHAPASPPFAVQREAGAADGAAPVRTSAMLGRRQAHQPVRNRMGARISSQWRRGEHSWLGNRCARLESRRIERLMAAAAVAEGWKQSGLPRSNEPGAGRVAGRDRTRRWTLFRAAVGVLRAVIDGRRFGLSSASGGVERERP